jgi:hypothetical protein
MKPAYLHLTVIAALSTACVMAYTGNRTAEVAILVEADMVEAPVTILSEHRDAVQRFKEIRDAQEKILRRANWKSEIEVQPGTIALSSGPVSDGYSSVYDYYRDESAALNVHVLAKLYSGRTLYDGAARIQEFLEDINLPSRTRLIVGQYRLAVRNPEQYRGILLRKISEYVEYTKAATGFSGVITLTGLQDPVLVRQVDERYVELFIDYTMTLETAAD